MEYTIDKGLKKIADKLVRTVPELKYIKDAKVRYVLLRCEREKKKNRKIIFADCEKVSDKYKWFCKYDFMITVYSPNVEEFSSEQMEILLMHELMHIGINWETDSDDMFYINPHDIEEFDYIVQNFGLHWER